MAKMTVVWDSEARNSFKKYLEYIGKDSLQAAEKVRDDILEVISELPDHPEKFPPDRFKTANDGSFRAFEKHSCRVAYLYTGSQIRILRVRHVKKEPRDY